MIKVNLLAGQKEGALPIFLGMDLNLLNFKGIGLALLLYTILSPILNSKIEGINDVYKDDLDSLRKSLSVAKRKGKGMKKIQAQLTMFEKEEGKLKARLVAVKEIIRVKKNPMNILLFLSKNIPVDVWIEKLIVKKDVLDIYGNADSYKSIGIFLEGLGKSIFFDQTLKLISAKTEIEKRTGRSIQVYNINSKIKRYE